jgi:hypothetical protein
VQRPDLRLRHHVPSREYLPEESVTASPNHVSLGPVRARLEKLDELPEGFCQTDAPMFYCALVESLLASLRGFSGGPSTYIEALHPFAALRLIAS